MFDEDLEEDDELEIEDDEDISFDEVAEIESEAVDDVELATDDDEDDEFPAAKKSGGKSKVADVDLPSLEAKNKERDELARAMEEFLSRGGKIQEVNPAD